MSSLILIVFLLFLCSSYELHSGVEAAAAGMEPLLSYDHYKKKNCPDVEEIVRGVAKLKLQQTFTTASGTLRLFFHDCFVEGCDASVMLASTATNKTEKDSPDDITLPGDAFDTIIKAKAAVDAVPQCRNKVSCADIMAMAARDAVFLTGGPLYKVELGRLDGRTTAATVPGHLPEPTFNLTQLTSLFATHGLTQTDMIALSGGHTIGFSHCDQVMDRLYGSGTVDPTLNKTYAIELAKTCPRNSDPDQMTVMDSGSPFTFDNQYYMNLVQRKGLFTSDQVLYEDQRSRKTVELFAANKSAFEKAFLRAMMKLGRVGVKTKADQNGEIRIDCSTVNL